MDAVRQLVELDVGCLLSTYIHLHLGGGDRSDNACYPISIIQSFKRLIQ